MGHPKLRGMHPHHYLAEHPSLTRDLFAQHHIALKSFAATPTNETFPQTLHWCTLYIMARHCQVKLVECNVGSCSRANEGFACILQQWSVSVWRHATHSLHFQQNPHSHQLCLPWGRNHFHEAAKWHWNLAICELRRRCAWVQNPHSFWTCRWAFTVMLNLWQIELPNVILKRNTCYAVSGVWQHESLRCSATCESCNAWAPARDMWHDSDIDF